MIYGNTVVEAAMPNGTIRRYGGTASMDRTFEKVSVTQIPSPIDYDERDVAVYKDEHVPILARLTAAIEAERVLRAPHAALAPEAHELWDDYAARLKKITGEDPPEVFRIQLDWPADLPARWESLQLGTSDGKILMGWMADFDEKRQRDEDAALARLAEIDRPLVLAQPKALARFRRAMKRIEEHVKSHAPVLRGILADLQRVRTSMGLARSRHGVPCGLDETIRFLSGVARAERHKQHDRQYGLKGQRNHRGNSRKRIAAWAFEHAAQHVANLRAAARGQASAMIQTPIRVDLDDITFRLRKALAQPSTAKEG